MWVFGALYAFDIATVKLEGVLREITLLQHADCDWDQEELGRFLIDRLLWLLCFLVRM